MLFYTVWLLAKELTSQYNGGHTIMESASLILFPTILKQLA